jgi:hypothetical protein
LGEGSPLYPSPILFLGNSELPSPARGEGTTTAAALAEGPKA